MIEGKSDRTPQNHRLTAVLHAWLWHMAAMAQAQIKISENDYIRVFQAHVAGENGSSTCHWDSQGPQPSICDPFVPDGRSQVLHLLQVFIAMGRNVLVPCHSSQV